MFHHEVQGEAVIPDRVRPGQRDWKPHLSAWARDRSEVAPPEGSQLPLSHVGSGLVRTPRAVLDWFLKQMQV